jgi:Mss4 protein
LPGAKATDPEGETVSHHWMIDDRFKFDNVGVTRSLREEYHRYLTCAECERGPIGVAMIYEDNPTTDVRREVYYVSHGRIKYKS